MIKRVLVPQAFENMEEATLGAWRKREGDQVRREEPLCELITEKTTFDLPSEVEGTLLHIAAREKSVLPVNAVLALCGPASTSHEDLQAAIAEAARDNALLLQKRASASPEQAPSLSVPSLASASGASASASSASGTRVRATPAARRAAKELGVEIEALAQKLPGKVLSEDDVRAFAAA